MTADRNSPEHRPSPDALLEAARRELRGRLKVFLGAAPGVGKTYEMLESGLAKKAEGVDVVIGVVETHGRHETAELLDGFEIIPRAKVMHKGQPLEEMDLDAILARKPALVLVDELAHTNAAGSRHPKRFQDVEELLANGIDVYTTLNIQHVESLNDVVAQITRIRVRETVPDSMIDRADDIEVIDLTPDDLIQRLHEGKVYLPGTAELAIRNYFKPGNLTALRELALRRTAQRVDDQLVSHMQANAIAGPWPAGDRVLVGISPTARGASLVRYAKRHADRMRAEWTAIYIEPPNSADLTERQKDRLSANLRLAERLGADIATRPGQDVAAEIIRFAQANNFTQIVIGKPSRPRWREMLEGSIANSLMRNAGDISVHVISGNDAAEPVGLPEPAPPQAARLRLRPYVFSVAYVLCAVGLGMLLDRFMFVQNIAMVFLLAILTSAVTAGFGPALFACLLSALAFNFFFLPPVYTLTIADPESVVAFSFFLVVALTASNLTARVQR